MAQRRPHPAAARGRGRIAAHPASRCQRSGKRSGDPQHRRRDCRRRRFRGRDRGRGGRPARGDQRPRPRRSIAPSTPHRGWTCGFRSPQTRLLRWLPQETILFDGARLHRSIEVDVADGGSLVMAESMVFGRTAMDETMRQGEVIDRWRIRQDGRLVFADTLRLGGDVAALLARPAAGGGATALATIVIAPADDGACRSGAGQPRGLHQRGRDFGLERYRSDPPVRDECRALAARPGFGSQSSVRHAAAAVDELRPSNANSFGRQI